MSAAAMQPATAEFPASTVHALAVEFTIQLAECLSDVEFAEVCEKNATPEYGGSCCASHDYIDANEVMAAAFHVVIGREIDLQSNDDCRGWSAAWGIAKDHFLSGWGAP